MFRFERLCALLTSLVVIACSAPPPPAVPAPQPPSAAASWVEESAERERVAAALERLFEERVCDALVAGRHPEPLPAAAVVRHDLPRVPPRDEWRHEADQHYLDLAAGPVREVPGSEWQQAFDEHLRAFGVVDDCEVTSDRYEETAQGPTLRSTLHLAGRDADGGVLEEHSRFLLEFSLARELRAMRLEEGHRVAAAAPLFADVTERWLGDLSEIPFAKPPRKGINGDTGGLAVVDVDRDGLLDVYLPQGGRNLFFHQTEPGRFEEAAERFGIEDPGNSRGAVFADFDGDGDLDLIVANAYLQWWWDSPVRFYRQEANGRFTDVSDEAVPFPGLRDGYTHVAVADVDLDGDLDAFIGGYGNAKRGAANHIIEADNGVRNLLLINDGDFHFRDEAENHGLVERDWTYAGAFADWDGDGDLDLYTANDWGRDRLYENDGTGRFRDVTRARGIEHPGFGMGVVWSDFDGDGRLDLYVSNMFSNAGSRLVPHARMADPAVHARLQAATRGNVLLFQRDRGFEDGTDDYGLGDGGWAWGAVAFDYDLDGDEDVYQVNGYYSGIREKDQ